jgi:major membrane immunogen (membrane-anchored lipoprotein)
VTLSVSHPEKTNLRKEIRMVEECELLDKCGFFKKYQTTKDLACKGFMRQYCRGPKMNECIRKEYRQKHGTPPSDDMMPSGQMFVMSSEGETNQ